MTAATLPKHLQDFPCMMPWKGCKYPRTRLLVIAESHYLPQGSFVNIEPRTWYTIKQCDLTPREQLYVNTIECVRERLARGDKKEVYNRINEFISFDRIAFFNYLFRPANYKLGFRSSGLKVEYKDKKVSGEVMAWFIKEHKPRAIIVASKFARDCGAESVAKRFGIECSVTDHPSARRGVFEREMPLILNKLGIRR